MATRITELDYSCYNDCFECMAGKKHKAHLRIQTTSDAIEFRDGQRNMVAYFDPLTLDLFLRMLDELDYLPAHFTRKSNKGAE